MHGINVQIHDSHHPRSPTPSFNPTINPTRRFGIVNISHHNLSPSPHLLPNPLQKQSSGRRGAAGRKMGGKFGSVVTSGRAQKRRRGDNSLKKTRRRLSQEDAHYSTWRRTVAITRY